MRSVSFITLGCKVNQYDTQAMQKAFAERGFQLVPDGSPADVVIVNTCTVTSEADRKSKQMLRRMVRANPDSLVVAAGCFVQGNMEAASSIDGISAFAGSSGRMDLVDFVADAVGSGDRTAKRNMVTDIFDVRTYEDLHAEGADGMSRAYLKIEDGCDSYCSYCYVPYVRGHVRSRPIASIEQEAGRLADAGFAEIILTGIHLGCYGRDFGGKPGLAEAIKAACKPDGIKRVRLSSLEPTELTEEILGLFGTESKLARHLHLPLQSGDDTILKAMNRSYDSRYFRKVVAEARREIGDFGLTTDVIVGFPGETEEMFMNTLRLVEEVGFQQVHAFPYSKRAGTPAALMSDQVPANEKRRRVRELIAASARLTEARLKESIGRTVEVVVETRLEGSGVKYGYEGYTGEYAKVRFSSPVKQEAGLVKVRVDGYGAGVLIGSAIANA